MKHRSLSLLLLLGAFALGCSKPAPPPAPPVEEPAPQPVVGEPVADPEDVRIEGDHLVIDRHINFAFDKDEILEDSFDLLDHITQLLKNHPEIVKLHVIGHTDAEGDADYNMKLSDRRANAVMKALKERGATQQIDAVGKGKTQNLCTEDTDECHAKNRRVEFIIETNAQ
ncbi:MAG: OmpA family protein [Nannocystis sp.]|nr:OmpA family protein [Nannocystis sp.]